jgi:hypothetical protein
MTEIQVVECLYNIVMLSLAASVVGLLCVLWGAV